MQLTMPCYNYYPVYTEQNYLDHDLDDINVDRDPEDSPVNRNIQCSIQWNLFWEATLMRGHPL